jgi:hypothetical protein
MAEAAHQVRHLPTNLKSAHQDARGGACKRENFKCIAPFLLFSSNFSPNNPHLPIFAAIHAPHPVEKNGDGALLFYFVRPDALVQAVQVMI